MEEFGRYLREEREARGITLQFVYERTRIRTTYLEAIEVGAFNRLPGRTYARAFLKLYAQAIGLDPSDVLYRFDELDASGGREVAASLIADAADGMAPASRPSERVARRRKKRKRQTWIVVGALVALVLGAGIWQALQPSDSEPVTGGADGLIGDVGIGNDGDGALGHLDENDSETEGSPDDVGDGAEPASEEPTSEEELGTGGHDGTLPEDGDESDPLGLDEGGDDRDGVGSGEESTTGEDAEAPDVDASGDDDGFSSDAIADNEETATDESAGEDDGDGTPPDADTGGESGDVADGATTDEPAGEVFRIELTFSDVSWVEAWVDGERVLYQIIAEGTVIVLEVSEQANFRFGVPSAVRVVVDGHDVTDANQMNREFTLESVATLRGQSV